ncbi:MAG: hypothetical protein KKB21_04150 [Nanoarchaeota archaeon]|nr:hypothetical protein [Nanoarchaeota archaeon]
MTNEQIRIRDAEFMASELADFLVRAKRTCYAGNGNEQILADGSKQLTFQQGNFHYTDNYAGYFQAPGVEIVRWQKPEGQRIWQMAYSGGMKYESDNLLLAQRVFKFLKRALEAVDVSAPFRDPECNTEDWDDLKPSFWDDSSKKELRYFARTEGDIRNFRGREFIDEGVWTVFEQDYIGGLVIPK